MAGEMVGEPETAGVDVWATDDVAVWPVPVGAGVVVVVAALVADGVGVLPQAASSIAVDAIAARARV